MSEESKETKEEVPTSDTTSDVGSSEKTEVESTEVKNTLESLTNEIIELRKRYDNEIKSLNDRNSSLTNQLKEQDALIGNYKEKLFNSSTPIEELENIEKINLEREYTGAFTSVYNRLKHRLTEGNNNKQLFVNRCMEALNGGL